MRFSLLLSVLLIAVAAFMTISSWQRANMHVRQQALQLRINAFKNEEEQRQSPWSDSELQSRQERLDDMQQELNSLNAQAGGAR
jgi:hypothetical protein